MPEAVVIFILGAVIGLFVSLAADYEHLNGKNNVDADPCGEHLWLGQKIFFILGAFFSDGNLAATSARQYNHPASTGTALCHRC
jgi:hypothetical protein